MNANDASDACVQLLEQVLADAKAGNITTVGVVACGPADFGAQIAGPDARSVYMGCGVLQDKIVKAVTQPAPIMRPKSAPHILRPRPVPKS
jgi:hypothetical protein